MFRRLHLTFRSVFQRKRVDEELDEELQYHLERQMTEELNAGHAPEEAKYAAQRAMGAITQSKEECRDMRRVNFIDDLSRDLQYAARAMRRSPGFAMLAVLIMGLGIGANTAVFSVVNAVLLRPLAYDHPDRIVTFTTHRAGEMEAIAGNISLPDFNDWREQNTAFDAMAVYGSREVPVMAGATAEYARGSQVGPEFFRVFAVQPIVGRLFSAEDTKPGSNGAAIISYSYWQSHFGGDASALGQTVRIYGKPYPVAGVLPAGFGFPEKTDVWVPAQIRESDMKSRMSNNWRAIGRLKSGVGLAQAQTEMSSIGRRLEQEYPESNKGRNVVVTRIQDEMVRDVRLTLYLLLGAVGVVLLIACANTATLLLGKATARTREIAVRASLGASQPRIIRQLVTESVLMALVAGAVGLLFAYGGSKALIALAPVNVRTLATTNIDQWVLAFTFGVSILTSLLFGLVPALYASRVDLNDALKQSAARSVTGGGMAGMRGVLVVAEIALAVVLLSAAGLLIKSFIALHTVALGFRPENVLVMRSTVPVPMENQAAPAFFYDLLPKIANLPGVHAAGATMAPPGYVDSTGAYFIDHLPPQSEWNRAPEAVLSIVAPGTFAALGIPIKNGRDFSRTDAKDKPMVAVVNEAVVRQSFHGENPIGRSIYCLFDTDRPMTIIGVAGDVRQLGPAHDPSPECYMPYEQHGFNGNTLSIVARTADDPTALQETMRRLARETSPDVPMKFTTMEASLSENVAAPRFRTLLFAVFAGLAVCLAMAGVYGVMAFAVGQRSSEIGLRIALGASAGSIRRLILGQGIALAGIGLAIGLAAAIAGTRLLTTMLFEVKPNDVLVYVTVTALLGAVALIASYIPARRASKIDPLRVMRQE